MTNSNIQQERSTATPSPQGPLPGELCTFVCSVTAAPDIEGALGSYSVTLAGEIGRPSRRDRESGGSQRLFNDRPLAGGQLALSRILTLAAQFAVPSACPTACQIESILRS